MWRTGLSVLIGAAFVALLVAGTVKVVRSSERAEPSALSTESTPTESVPTDAETTHECSRQWSDCPEADWVRLILGRAGYRVTGETGSAVIAEGNRAGFFIWTTAGTRTRIVEVARREEWRPLGSVDGVIVYGDERLWRWWVVDNVVFWLHAGPSGDSRLPPLEGMESLVAASRFPPPPR